MLLASCLPASVLVAGLIFQACGSNGADAVVPTGPDLDIGELTAIRVDQLKFTGGTENDKDGIPEATLYLRCSNSNADVVCVGTSNGLELVKKPGAVYGRLDASFQRVDGATQESCFDSVMLVFVEKDSSPCPAPIGADDDIVWTSTVLSVNDAGKGTLLDSKIASDDGANMAYFTTQGTELLEDLVLATTPQAENTLKIDQLYFKRPDIGSTTNFTLIVREPDEDTFRCKASFNETSGIEKEDIIYGNLDIALVTDMTNDSGNPCLITEENKLTNVVTSLYIEDNTEPLRTEESTLVDLVNNDGEKENFGEDGYVRFVPIETYQ